MVAQQYAFLTAVSHAHVEEAMTHWLWRMCWVRPQVERRMEHGNSYPRWASDELTAAPADAWWVMVALLSSVATLLVVTLHRARRWWLTWMNTGTRFLPCTMPGKALRAQRLPKRCIIVAGGHGTTSAEAYDVRWGAQPVDTAAVYVTRQQPSGFDK